VCTICEIAEEGLQINVHGILLYPLYIYN
jgi:hypothetical protein